jgi:hypothetical protein
VDGNNLCEVDFSAAEDQLGGIHVKRQFHVIAVSLIVLVICGVRLGSAQSTRPAVVPERFDDEPATPVIPNLSTLDAQTALQQARASVKLGTTLGELRRLEARGAGGVEYAKARMLFDQAIRSLDGAAASVQTLKPTVIGEARWFDYKTLFGPALNKAADELLEAAEKFSGDPRLCLKAAMIKAATFYESDRKDLEARFAALDWLEKAIQLSPNQPEAYRLRSELTTGKDRVAKQLADDSKFMELIANRDPELYLYDEQRMAAQKLAVEKYLSQSLAATQPSTRN